MQNRRPISKPDHAPAHLALYQPEIPLNVGAILRLGACFGMPVHVIEPCGFPFNPRAWRRSAMDYAALAELHRHDSWADFLAKRPAGRLVAMTTRGVEPLWGFAFRPGDTILLGPEGSGLPGEVRDAAAARVAIPLVPGARSLNLAMAAAIAAAESVRQLAAAAQPPRVNR